MSILTRNSAIPNSSRLVVGAHPVAARTVVQRCADRDYGRSKTIAAVCGQKTGLLDWITTEKYR